MEMFCLSWLFEQDLLKYTKKTLLDMMLTGCRCLSAYCLTFIFIFFKWFTPTLCCTDFFFLHSKKRQNNIRKAKYKEWSLTSQALVHGTIFPFLLYLLFTSKAKHFFSFFNWWMKSLEKMGMLLAFSPNWFPVFICFVKLAAEHRFSLSFLKQTLAKTHTHAQTLFP